MTIVTGQMKEAWRTATGRDRSLYILFHSSLFLVTRLEVKDPPANAKDIRDVGLIPALGRSPGEGHGNPLQYSCLENPTDIGAWQATGHRFTKSRT